jgi:hypothetical protein
MKGIVVSGLCGPVNGHIDHVDAVYDALDLHLPTVRFRRVFHHVIRINNESCEPKLARSPCSMVEYAHSLRIDGALPPDPIDTINASGVAHRSVHGDVTYHRFDINH